MKKKKYKEKIITALELVRNLAPLDEVHALLFYGFNPDKVIESWWDFNNNLHLILKY